MKNTETGSTISTGSLMVTNQEQTETMAASDIGAITQDIVIKTEFDCSDSQDQGYGWLVGN